jgi:predicted transcriptional regulator
VFRGLSRLSTGTAKQLNEITAIPRTRIYDAIRVLEAQGLVEIQHSSPQQIRAVPIKEATETLRDRYEERVERVGRALEETESIESQADEPAHEVLTLRGAEAIGNRTTQLVQAATEEVILVLGHQSLAEAHLPDSLGSVGEQVALYVGAVDEPLREALQDLVPQAETFVSGLKWLKSEDTETDPAVGRILLVDKSTMLVSTVTAANGEDHAVYPRGFTNGIVVVARRLMTSGIRPTEQFSPE